MRSKHLSGDKLGIIAAFFAVYVIWGSTYLVNYLAIQAIPPFLMCGTRFITAGSILFAIARISGAPLPTWRQWGNALLTGFLFLSLGTGFVVWAEQYVDTGMAALLVSFEPLVVVLFVWAMQGRRPLGGVLFGIALGVAGMALLIGQPQLAADARAYYGVIAIAISIIAWAYATIFIVRIDLPASRPQTAAMQMLSGGAVLQLASWLTGEHQGFSWSSVSAQAWWAMAYLIFAGSIIAFSAFNYLLLKVKPEQVATSNYVNPVVALFLGWAFNSEVISGQSVFAAVLLLAGVFFINSRAGISPKGLVWRRRRQTQPPNPTNTENA